MGQTPIAAVVLKGSSTHMRKFREKNQWDMDGWGEGNEVAMTGYGLVVTE